MVTDLTGQRVGRLVVLERTENDKYSHARWKTLCDCGQYKVVQGRKLKEGSTRSCGCLRKEMLSNLARKRATHGQSGNLHQGRKPSPTYYSWVSMKQRCTNPNAAKYSAYGGSGVTICDRWINSFENFLQDKGPRPKGTTLDRYPDKTGNYEPGNTRWATAKEQNNNRRWCKGMRYKKRNLLERISELAA